MGYRVTKYNPKYRDNRGAYTKDEWTSVCEIGKNIDDNILTAEEYLKIEDSYITAVLKALDEHNIKEVHVKYLEIITSMRRYAVETTYNMKKLFYTIRAGKTYSIDDMPALCRLMLREYMWGLLEFEDKFEIRFGYDYYMYFQCTKLSEKTIAEISSLNLFIEDFDYSYFDRGEEIIETFTSHLRNTVRSIIRKVKFLFIWFNHRIYTAINNSNDN